MGNRAVITTDKSLKEIGLYLHWNGGRDSVEGFLAYCKLKGYRQPEYDSYGWVCLAGVCFNFFGNGLSCDIACPASRLDCDNWDNGVYVIKDWLIVDRCGKRGGEQYGRDLRKFVEEIDKRQPEQMQLTLAEWAKFDEVKATVIAARG